MRRTWIIPAVVAVFGALAGILIAGRPDKTDILVIPSPATVTSSPTTSAAANPSSTVAVTSTSGPADTTTPAPATTVGSATTVASTPASSTPTTIAAATTTSAPTGTVDRADVRVVVANGDGRFNLAGVNGNRLEKAGYVQIDLEDASRVPATILYYRPGFDDEAAIVAADLLVPNAILAPLPDTPITSNDSLGDVVVVLGPDAVR